MRWRKTRDLPGAYPPRLHFPSDLFPTFPEQMFASSQTPLSARLRRGLDLAVQFATLGEIAVDEAPQPARRRRPASPPQAWRPARTASQVVTATAAARRQGQPPQRRHGEPPKPPQRELPKRVSTRAAVRSVAMRP